MNYCMYNFTLKGDFGKLTEGQGLGLIGKGHVAYQLICIFALNTYMVFSSL